MIRDVQITTQQAQGLAQRLEDQGKAQLAANHYLSALCDGLGLTSARLVNLTGTTLVVEVPDDGPES